MSSSERLRKTHTAFGGGKRIFNERAVSHEKNTQEAMKTVLQQLRHEYPQYEFTHESTLSKKEINEALRVADSRYGTYQWATNTSIRPDGGFILARSASGKKHLVLTSEAKKQGTNDIRALEGKKKQGCGNAIERACKNVNEVRNYLINEDYFPYVMFCCGCDFLPESTIPDRLTSLTYGQPFNKLYIANEKLGRTMAQKPSIFLEPGGWSLDKMVTILRQAAEEAMCFIEKSTEPIN